MEDRLMTGCRACRHLEGQCTDARPAREMRAVSQHFTRGGMFETYRCRACGSQWERFVTTEAGEGSYSTSGPWKHLSGKAPSWPRFW